MGAERFDRFHAPALLAKDPSERTIGSRGNPDRAGDNSPGIIGATMGHLISRELPTQAISTPRRLAGARARQAPGLLGSWPTIVCIASLALTGCAGPATSGRTPQTSAVSAGASSTTGAPAPSSSNGVITVEGSGTDSSRPMTLTTGTYVVIWAASPLSTTACQHSAALESTNEDYIHELMNERITKPRAGQRVVVKAVKAGSYYFDVNSECSWRFMLMRAP